MKDGKTVVLHVRTVFGSGGGPDKTVLLSGEYLDKGKFRVICVYLKSRNDPHYGINEKIKNHAIDYREIIEKWSFDPGILGALSNLIRQEQVDIYHAHEYKSDVLGWLLSKRMKFHLVTTAHAWVRDTLREKIYIWWDKRILPRFDRVIAVSELIRRELLSCGVAESKIDFIHNGIDVKAYDPERGVQGMYKEKLGVKSQEKVIGFVGRLTKQKNLDGYLPSFAKMDLSETTLLIVGEGPEKKRLEALVNTLDIHRSVRFLGYKQDILEIYKAIDVLVLPSHYEGLPNVVLEAMAMEIPVVATKVSGVVELIQDHQNGRLVDKGAMDQMNHIVQELLLDEDLRKGLGRQAREVICKDFSFSDRMKKIADLYQELMQQKLK